MADAPKTTIEMPPEFTADSCESAAALVQYRIDRCIERDGSREAAIKAGGISLSIGHMEMVVGALNKGASEIRSLLSALKEAQERAADWSRGFDTSNVRCRELETELASLRARCDALAAERDEALKWLNLAEKDNREVSRALGHWLLVPPDGGDLRLGEGVDLLKADRDALAAALKGAVEALEPLGALAVKEVSQRPGLMAVAFLTDFLRARAALASIKAALGETQNPGIR